MDGNFQYDLFMSHSAKDKKVVLALVRRLELDGLKIWLAEHEIKGGTIAAKIDVGLRVSKLLLVVLSKNGIGSEWIDAEKEVFINRDPANKQKRIIVIQLDKTEPDGLLSIRTRFSWTKKSKTEYSELLEFLKERVTGKAYEPGQATIARVYDYFLGGDSNTNVDKNVAKSILKKYPDAQKVVISNRAFLRRTVRYLAEAGIKQFVDIGSGLPTQGNTHEIAQKVCPDARIVYVDYDNDVVDISRKLLKQGQNDKYVRVVLGDLTKPNTILRAPDMKLIDFQKPVALLMIAVIHFILDNNTAQESVKVFYRKLAIGSFVAISHVSIVKKNLRDIKVARDFYKTNVANVKLRRREKVLELFDRTILMAPGLVFASEWRPEIKDHYIKKGRLPFTGDPHRSLLLTGVGVVTRKL